MYKHTRTLREVLVEVSSIGVAKRGRVLSPAILFLVHLTLSIIFNFAMHCMDSNTNLVFVTLLLSTLRVLGHDNHATTKECN